MSRSCQTCGGETEEVFHIPWLAKFYRCDNGHCEAREPEGGRAPSVVEYVEQMKDCRLYAERFKESRNRRGSIKANAQGGHQ
jgi:hypothetical protein